MNIDKNVVYGGDEVHNLCENFNSLGELLLKKLSEGKDKEKFINGKTGEKCTANQLLTQSISIAKNLKNLGIKKNDKIAIVSENRFEFVTIALGCFYVGATVVPINLSYKELELEHAFKLVNPNIVCVSNFSYKTVSSVAENFNFKLINIDEPTSFGILLENCEVGQFMEQNIDPDSDVCAILYSSGTTGLPKGAQLSHTNFLDALPSTTRFMTEVSERSKSDEGFVFLNVSPWFHIFGLIMVFESICMENTKMVFLVRFEEEVFLRSIQDLKVNAALVVPTLLLFMAKTPLLDKYDVSHLKEVACGGSTVSKEVETEFKKRLNVRVTKIYGMTETTGLLSYSRYFEKYGSLGELATNVHGKVVKPDGTMCGRSEVGELCFKTKRNTIGYYRNEKATNDMIDTDGWLHTGDIGYFDDENSFFMIDRLKDLIKYNSFQVSPAEVEGILLMNPKIKEAAVVGVPDKKCGELTMAFVVKQPNVELTEKEVIDFVAGKTSKIKHLHGGARFVDELPKNPSGKILRRSLRDKVIDQLTN